MPRKSSSSSRQGNTRTSNKRRSTTKSTQRTASARRDRAKNRSDISTTRARRPRTVQRRRKSGGSNRKRNRLILVVIAMLALGYGGVMLGDSLIRAAATVNSESFGDLWDKMKARLFDADIPRVAPRPEKKTAPAKDKADKSVPAKKAATPKLDDVQQPKSARAELKAPANPEDYARATAGKTEEMREQEKARARLDRLLGNR